MPKIGSQFGLGPYTFTAAAAITQGHAVKLTANVNEVEVCDSAGEASYGVALQTVGAGEPVAVLRKGRFDRAVAGAALATPNVKLMVNASGRYIAATATNKVVGRTLTTAAADGDLITIELDDANETMA